MLILTLELESYQNIAYIFWDLNRQNRKNKFVMGICRCGAGGERPEPADPGPGGGPREERGQATHCLTEAGQGMTEHALYDVRRFLKQTICIFC